MFDKTIVQAQAQPRYPQTVIEKRAPTDESIKIYAEMLAKARAEVLSVVLNQIPGNELSHAVVTSTFNIETITPRVEFCFKLNGVEHRVPIDYDDVEKSREAVAREILGELVARVGAQLFSMLPRR